MIHPAEALVNSILLIGLALFGWTAPVIGWLIGNIIVYAVKWFMINHKVQVSRRETG